MNHPCFTVILEFRGGTSVAQVHASSAREALESWLLHLEQHVGDVVPTGCVERLCQDLRDDDLVALVGVRNVWCISSAGSVGSALVNIVETRLG